MPISIQPLEFRRAFWSLVIFFIIPLYSATAQPGQDAVQENNRLPILEGSYNPTAVSPVFLPETAQNWTPLADAIEPRVEGHSAVLDGKIYVFGGFQTEGIVPTDQNEVYDIATNTWSTFAPLPVPNTHVGSAEADGKVWIAGGFALIGYIQTVDLVWIYDPVTDSFSDGPPLPAPRAGGALVRLGRKLHYISGLINRNDTVGDHFVLDLDEPGGPQTWKTLAPMPDSRDHFSGIAVGGKIYTIGGQFGHDINPQDTDLVHSYDPVTDTWTEVADLPFIRSHFEPGTIVVDGKIIIAGGRTGTQNCVDNITEYDPATNTWTELFTMPDCRLAPSAKVVDDQMYLSHGGVVSVLFPTTDNSKHEFDRSPSTQMAFTPASHTTTLAPGESEKLEALLWTLTDEADYNISLAGLPSWISSVSKSSGVANHSADEIDITLNTAGLAPGVYSHTFTATAPGYDNATLTVQLTVAGDGEPILSFSPSSIDLGTVPAGHTSRQSITLTNEGSGTAVFDGSGLDASLLQLSYSGAAVDVMIHPEEALLALSPGQSTTIDFDITLLEAGAASGTASYPYLSDGVDANVSLTFSATGTGTPVARINAGAGAISPGIFADWDGDVYFDDGKTFSNPSVTFINGTLDQEPYKSERSATTNLGSFAYHIPVPSAGTYITRLHFAETFFGAPGGSIDFVGRRVFDINFEGGLVELEDYDIAAEVGPITAVVKSFVTEVNDGTLDIEFMASVDQPKVSAIEVFQVDLLNNQPLAAGWNMVGLPLTPSNSDPASIYDEVSIISSPFAYENGDYVSKSTMEMGTGYWLKTESGGFQSYTGTSDTDISLTLASGWNMISGPSCPAALDDAGGDVGILQDLPAYGYTAQAGYISATTLQPGVGYWVKTSAAGTISLSCSPGKSGETTQAARVDDELLPEDALTLAIQDANGLARRLFIADQVQTANKFTLPPIPPLGQPDLRFLDGSNLMTADEALIKLQGLEAPLSISLSGYSDQALYLALEDGDNWIVVATLVSGEEAEIDEPALSRIRLSKEAPQGSDIPDEINVHGAFPNPMQSQFTVTFDIPESARVHVELYDILGKRVLQTAPRAVEAGPNRTVLVENQTLASGAYMYRLVLDAPSGLKTATGKVIVVN